MTRGGRREGAGRPLAGDTKRVRVSLTLPPDLVESLDREADTYALSRSEMLVRILADRFKGVEPHGH